MLNLVDSIQNVRDDTYINKGNKSGFTEEGVEYVSALLKCDRLVKAAPYHDAIIVTDKNQTIPVVGSRFYGDIFFDKNNRFKDGNFIITSPVVKVVPIYSEITLIETNNTTYLVIQ